MLKNHPVHICLFFFVCLFASTNLYFLVLLSFYSSSFPLFLLCYRLVTLENCPAITPELLRIFQNMSALLGKHTKFAWFCPRPRPPPKFPDKKAQISVIHFCVCFDTASTTFIWKNGTFYYELFLLKSFFAFILFCLNISCLNETRKVSFGLDCLTAVVRLPSVWMWNFLPLSLNATKKILP